MKQKFFIIAASMALVGMMTSCSLAVKQEQVQDLISADQAKTAALQASQTASSGASFTATELDEKSGIPYYQVNFAANGLEYRYAIDAQTGTVIESTSQAAVSNNSSSSGPIDQEKAKQIALEHADVKENDTAFLWIEQERDDGVLVYEIEFYVPATNKEYDYEIDASTGEIRSFDYEAENYKPSSSNAQSSNNTQPKTAIDQSKAKQIALEHANVKENDTAFLRVEQDRDDGVWVYEIEFYVPTTNTEYDYEIDASTGEIRSFDYEAENYTSNSSSSQGTNKTLKSKDEIQKIALAKVPGASAQNILLKLEEDDGSMRYEGEIRYQGMEYEFEIDAYSGAIREWDADPIDD